jgi:hypothetical protein
MLDIFDDCNGGKSEYGHGLGSKDKDLVFDQNSFMENEFMIQEEDILEEEDNTHEENNMLILSRKGSGVEAQAMDTRLGFEYQSGPCLREDATVVTTNSEIGAALTPNENLKETFARRATRESDSDKEVMVNVKKEGCGKKGSMERAQEMLNEKFDYKKYVNQELAKLGNICGWFLKLEITGRSEPNVLFSEEEADS